MFKLFHKKLNKKGFTLAELLVVVAILAILVAVAIPIFTASLEDAQLRVNLANIRSVKAAGVTNILTNPDKYAAGEHAGWRITAKVSQNGQITNLKVEAKTKIDDIKDDGIVAGTGSAPADDAGYKTTNAEIKKQKARGDNEYYFVLAYATDLSTPEAAN